jgi:undecaprenyl-diphosphatase
VDPDIFGLDKAIFDWVYGLPLPTLPVEIVSHLATRGGIWVLAAVSLIAFRGGLDRRTGFALGAGLIAHVVLVEGAVKHLVARTRPFQAFDLKLRDSILDPDSYSFPSGHCVASFMGAFVLGARFPKARTPLMLLAMLVAISRVHLGAHYPSDVFVGAAIGMLLGVAVVSGFGIMTDEEKKMREGDRPAAVPAKESAPEPPSTPDEPSKE